MISIAPTLADLESLLERAERDLVRAEMLDAPVRRAAEVATCKTRVDDIKAQIATIEGWTPWGDGPCPVGPEDRLEYRLGDGRQYRGIANRQNWHHCLPGSPGLGRLDIVAYRRARP